MNRRRINAIWNRLKLIPFNVVIPKERQDKELGDKLKGELSGILAWALQGHMEWLQDGLGEPEEVSRSTAEYRDGMDALGTFLDDECVVDLSNPDLRVKAKILQERYSEWYFPPWDRGSGPFCIPLRPGPHH